MNTQLANDLRALADRIEQLPDGMSLYVDFKAHAVDSREKLRAMAALMDTPVPHSVSGTHWLTGSFVPHSICVTAFYRPGLLGATKTVLVEDEADLSLLEVQS